MKVFISHKSTDASSAYQVQQAFKGQGVDAYLDLLDDFSGEGEKLTAHIREQLNKCSDIIVVMSNTTISSWWVPFEIGMSAQKDMPTATFLTASIPLPDYLSYWPRLTKISDISKYVLIRNRVWRTDALFESRMYASVNSTSEFYRQLKAELR
jgi:hypothetical protein